MSDNVNHPSHYTFGKYEAFDVMLVQHFISRNALKM